FVISATSKVPDAAFQVIQTYHTDEVQISLTRDAALITELVDPDIHKQYGANIPSTEGKNIMANFLGTQAVKVKMTHAQIINPIVVEALAQIASGEKDVNTAMREAEERARLAVAEYEASK